MQFPAVAIDCETLLFSKGRMAPPLVCVSFADCDGRAGLLHHTEVLPFVKRALASGAQIIGAFFAYDAAVLMAHAPELVEPIFEAYDNNRISDVLVREQLIDLRRGLFQPGKYKLELVAKRRLNVDLAKDDGWRTWYSNLRDKPLSAWPDAAKRYAIDDAIATRDIWTDQGPSPADEYNQVRSSLWLHLCSVWGIRTDPARVEALAGALETERDSLLSVLQAQGLVRPDGTRNMVAVQRRVIEAFGSYEGPDALYPQTPSGKPKTDADTCNRSGDDVLVKYGRLGEVTSKLNNYVKLLRTGTVHARYGLAETGRTTCSPNVQNLPRSGGVRECFTPRPGWVFAGADYDGLELRTVAQSCLKLVGHSNLAKALNAGLDPHLQLAASILGIGYEEAKARKKAGDHEIDMARQTAKVANFGFPGGLGVERFVDYARGSYGVIITPERALELKSQWLATWPEFVAYFAHISVLDSVVQLFSGRVRGGDVPYTVACNSFFQGLGADAAKRAGWLITRACYVDRPWCPSCKDYLAWGRWSPGLLCGTCHSTTQHGPLYGSRVALFCHDEFLIEIRDNDNAPRAAAELARLMCEGANEFLPDVPATTEPVLMRYYSKNAKAVFDNNGVLVPWSEAA